MIEYLNKSYRIPLLTVVISLIFYWTFAYQLDRTDFPRLFGLVAALFFFAYVLIKFNSINLWLLIIAGILFRLLFFPAIPNLSQDFYRFLWDGRLLIQGINPYLITPEMYLNAGNEVVPQARELYEGMGALNGSHFSNYPPINQLCFAIAALFAKHSILGSVMVLKSILIAADIGILYFGRKLLAKMKLPANNIFWYFLNPFVIIELTGNLHFEGVMLFFLIWSLYLLTQGKWFWAAVLFGISISVKLLPLLLLPLLFKWFFKKEIPTATANKTSFWRALNLTSSIKFYLVVIGTVLLTFAPFLSSEFVSNFAATISLWFQNFEFNASVYYIIRWIGFQTVGWNIIETVGKILPIVVVLFILGMSFFRKNQSAIQLITAMLFCVSVYFLLSTTVHPWYIATPLLLAVFTNYKFPIVWSLAAMLSYSAYGASGFEENLWLVALEYTLVICFALWELRKRHKIALALQKGLLLP